MRVKLEAHGRTAEIETLGGELVSCKDQSRPGNTSGRGTRPTGRAAIRCCSPLWAPCGRAKST